MEINSNHSTYGAAFRQKPIFFMSGKETVAYFEGKLKKNMTLQEDTCTLGSNDLLQFWHLHTQKQVHEQEAYAINVPFSVFVFFPNFIWNSSYLNIIFASCIKLFSYFGCQHCIKFFFLLQICCPFLCHSESIHSP